MPSWIGSSSKDGPDRRKERSRQQEGKFIFSKEPALYALEHSTWTSAFANQGWPILEVAGKMKGDPNKRNRNKYCYFHRDHRHDTDECFDLKQQIENLIRQGKLRNFLERDHKDEKLKGKVEESSRPLLGEIRVFIRETLAGQSSKSRKTYLKVVQNIQLSGWALRMRGADE